MSFSVFGQVDGRKARLFALESSRCPLVVAAGRGRQSGSGRPDQARGAAARLRPRRTNSSDGQGASAIPVNAVLACASRFCSVSKTAAPLLSRTAAGFLAFFVAY
jgi:hypothetical protein